MTPVLQQVDRVFVLADGTKQLFFGGFDYHRLGTHPALVEAAANAAREHGLTTGGSRVTTGTHPLHEELERELAAFVLAEAALVVPTGYLANLIAVRALADHADRIALPQRAHPSLRDAAQMAGLSVCDLNVTGSCHLIATDGVFGARGDIPPLRDYVKEIRSDGWLLTDDCHAVGTVGAEGRGSWEACGLTRKQLVQTGTLGKALGGFGGFIAADRAIIETCRGVAAFVGSSALPPPNCAAGLAALRLLREHIDWIDGLQKRSVEAKVALRSAGYELPLSPAPILSIVPADAGHRERLCLALVGAGIYPSYATYPGAPAGGHFRFALSSVHTDEQVALLLATLVRAARS